MSGHRKLEARFFGRHGACPFCGDLKPVGRARWHSVCVTEYRIANWTADRERAVRRRDDGVCAVCAQQTEGWEIDHIRPLVSGRGLSWDERRALFGLANLQTLCRACHVAKTSREAGERAKARKAAA